MLNAKAFANAATIVTAGFYVLCFAISSVEPDFVFGIGSSWVHSLSLSSLKTTEIMSLNTAIWGLITLCAIAWITMYVTIELYNKLAKK